MFLQSKLKEFSKTQWKLKDFSKTQGQNSPQNCKNSRFRKLHLPTLPKKRLKKIPDISREEASTTTSEKCDGPLLYLCNELLVSSL